MAQISFNSSEEASRTGATGKNRQLLPVANAGRWLDSRFVKKNGGVWRAGARGQGGVLLGVGPVRFQNPAAPNIPGQYYCVTVDMADCGLQLGELGSITGR